MHISRDGSHWGSMQVKQEGSTVLFQADGKTAGYGEILRVWGLRTGAQPLLIGVAEPTADGGLRVTRRMSRQQLAALGYEKLPEAYYAGIKPPSARTEQTDPLVAARLESGELTQTILENGRVRYACRFAADAEFPLAFIFSCCRIQGDTALLDWDAKRGCPIQTAPEISQD